MNRHTLPLLTLLLMAQALSFHMPADAQNGDEGSKRLAGTWVTNITANPIIVCSNGQQIAPAPPPFVQLATYADGGTFTETNTELNAFSSGSALGLNGSDGHGAWKKEGATFKTTFRKLLFAPVGQYVGSLEIREQVAVEQPSQLSGSFTAAITFLNGSLSLCSSGTFSGQRMTAD